MDSSLRPKANPRLAAKPMRPKRRTKKAEDAAFDAEMSATMKRAIKNSQPDTLEKMAKGGKVSEYGGKENYKSKASMMQHEGMESPAMERKERKMAGGGMCRGMGAATKGGRYKG